SKSDVLLLDEPTNHLDLLGIEWLENYLIHSTKALIIVSHDRTFLDRVTEKTLEIEDGNLYLYPGNYSIYQNLKTEREQKIQRDFELQQREIRRLKRLVRQYRQWGLEG
ncbi:energy-dependent translational throttle protein EttA, partial [Mycobacterium kansasii]